jgi:hypothetical protein
MKLKITFLFLLVTTALTYGQTTKDLTVQAWVETNEAAPSITINWKKVSNNVTSYDIYRKSKDASAWGTIVDSCSAHDTMWTDTNITIGSTYEYRIQKMNGAVELGVTYILSGIRMPIIHNRGSLLVISEQTLTDSIPNEINSYLKDLAGDGWNVEMYIVSKTDSIQKIKRLIKNYNLAIGNLKTVIIIGHVPVPYSGNYSPDGHSDHAGCWPTDAYYVLDYEQWLDEEINYSGIARNENINMPGDGKWDNNILPAKVNFYTGRIDLSNMPAFSKNEAQLTKQYFNKNHKYRLNKTAISSKGVIEDNFTTLQGAYSSAAWRSFSVMLGPDNIEEGDYLTKCQSQNLLFGFGAGAGTYNSCAGIATTDSFKNKKGAIFNMFFGSYFGDWDNSNNFLRAPLASPENGLTVAWSGRPYWQNHPLALGEPMGYCALLTQNNQGIYKDNSFGKTVHMGLMGDPTLRLNYFCPPDSLTANLEANNTTVQLQWKASSDSDVIGYFIYRSQNIFSNNIPLNTTPITELTFTDAGAMEGTNYYLVKALKLSVTPSGSYYNLSQGVEIAVSGVTPNVKPIVKTRNSTLYLDATGSAVLQVSDVDSGSSALFTIDSYILSKSTFSCSDIGVNSTTLTVTDIQNNSNAAQAYLTVLDTISPTVLIKNDTINLVNGTATLNANDIDNGSYDNCGISSMTVYPSNFNCTHAGLQTVTLTVTDVNGNISSAQARVFILSAPIVNILVTRTDTTYTGGVASNIYLGYGAQKVSLNAVTTEFNNYSYVWSPSNRLSCTTCAKPLFSPKYEGNYSYMVTVTNNFGCTSTSTITLCVVDVRADDDDDDIYICHKSPNSTKYTTKEISKKAVAAYLKKYPNDKLGRCNKGCNLNKMSLLEEEEELVSDEIKFSPNPFSNSFKLNFDRENLETASLEISDILGKQLLFYTLNSSSKDEFYGENLPVGIYMATFRQGSISKTFRLVKID